MMTTIALAALRASVILAVALVAMRLLARASAATRRSVLVGAFAIVLVLPIASALLPAFHLRAPEAAEATAPESAPVLDPIDSPGYVVPTARRATAPNPATSSAAPTEEATTVTPLAIVFALWALGAAAVLARLAVGMVRARRLVRKARFVETLDIGGRPVEVRISDAIETPGVTGLIVPVVLLPKDAETWTDERRRVVLAHELAHVASHDCLSSALAQLAVAMHWFDPLVWIAARRLRIERELAADDRVIEGGVPASSYATHLLALATGGAEMPTGALAMAETAQVSVRIRALLATPPRKALGRTRLVALLASAVVVSGLVACTTPEREEVPAPTVAEAPVPAVPHGATIDPQVQAILEQEIDRMNTEWAPCAAILLVLDPQTGNVLGASYRGGTETSAELAAVRPMVAGSTMKPLVVAAALEDAVIKPNEQFDATPLKNAAIVDSEPHGLLDVGEILAVSSNVGLAKIAERMGAPKLAVWARRFHFASAPGAMADPSASTAMAIGGLASTPLEVTAAFATLANGGVYHAPSFVSRRDAGERIVRADTAETVLTLLAGVTSDRGTGKAARVAGIRVAGKTGTAHLGGTANSTDYYASFVGAAPAEAPRYVVFVGAETPRDSGSGGQVAAPVFGRVMTRLLAR